MLNTAFPSWPAFTQEEADAVQQVLLSNRVNYWTGEQCREFEAQFARYIGADYGIAVANGTVAIELCLKALGIGPGDEVIVPPRTFVATASAVVAVGAKPVFADIDRDSQNIDPAAIEQQITAQTRAIICVHLAGWPCDMPSIMALAERHNLYVVEDCAQSHGAAIAGKKAGHWGHMAAFSFCQDKIMTTGGEGGMVLTSDETLWRKAWSYKDHGKDWDAVYSREHPPGFRWLHEHFGTNFRMMEMQAAIGLIQLARLPDWQRRRSDNAQRFADAFSTINGVRIPLPEAGQIHAWYRFYMFVEPEKLAAGWSRDRIMNEVTQAGVPCMSGSCSEIYLEQCFARAGLQPADRLPVARELGETSLMLLVHPTLEPAHIDQMIDVIRPVLEQACAP